MKKQSGHRQTCVISLVLDCPPMKAGPVFIFSDTIANKLHMQKVSDFVLSPGGQPSKVSSHNHPTAETV